ncbi:hypothetical protein AAMO2058_001756300 [Amorphochlora amoebiformis]
MALTMLTAILLLSVASTGLVRAILKIPLPEKWPWVVFYGLLTLDGLGNALYQYGGRYVVLLPFLFPLRSAVCVTGTIGLGIAVYSSVHKAQINPHWYSLPTGCAPVAMLAQYISPVYFQGFILAITMGFLAFKKIGKEYLLGMLVYSLGALALEIAPPVKSLESEDCFNIAAAFCAGICALVSTTENFKLKIL